MVIFAAMEQSKTEFEQRYAERLKAVGLEDRSYQGLYEKVLTSLILSVGIISIIALAVANVINNSKIHELSR